MHEIWSKQNVNVLIIGDLNADPKSRQGKILANFANGNNFAILNNTATRYSNYSSSILDQCLCNFSNLLKDSKILPPISSSDHCVLALEFKMKFHQPIAYQRTMWDFKNANYSLYRDEISNTNWEVCFEKDSINDICLAWTETLLSIAKKHIPNKLVTVRPRDKPWYNSQLRELRRQKERLFNKYKESKANESWEEFKRIRKEYAHEIETAKHEFDETKFSELAANANRNSKKWWSILKDVASEKNVNQDSISPIKHDSEYVTDDKQKANLFNKFFLSISMVDDSNHSVNTAARVAPGNTLKDIVLNEQEILDQLSILNVSKSYGPDGIPPKILKEGGKPLSKILHKFFSLSLDKCKFLLQWKRANVTPIHKSDDKSMISNYRPVSLLSATSKVFEKIIFKHIYNHLKDNFILTDFQSGFLPGRSTVTQLFEVYHALCQSVDNEKEVRVVFLDIKKAFDRVWHKGLIYKLISSRDRWQTIAMDNE